jgi:hypothetical protein
MKQLVRILNRKFSKLLICRHIWAANTLSVPDSSSM